MKVESEKEITLQIETIKKNIGKWNPDGTICFEMARKYRELTELQKLQYYDITNNIKRSTNKRIIKSI